MLILKVEWAHLQRRPRPTAPQVRSFVDLTPEQQKGYNAELKPYADKVKAAQKQFTEEQKAKGVPFTNAFATWQDMPHPSKDEFVAAAKDLDAKYGIRQYGNTNTCYPRRSKVC
jgi:hypothetical protein